MATSRHLHSQVRRCGSGGKTHGRSSRGGMSQTDWNLPRSQQDNFSQDGCVGRRWRQACESQRLREWLLSELHDWKKAAVQMFDHCGITTDKQTERKETEKFRREGLSVGKWLRSTETRPTNTHSDILLSQTGMSLGCSLHDVFRPIPFANIRRYCDASLTALTCHVTNICSSKTR